MRGTPLRSLGRSLQAFEARTVPRVYANILVSRGLREPFRGRWFCSEISPEGTFHRKRPKVPRTRPSLDRCKIFCAVTPWPLLSKNRRLKAVSAKVSSARGSLHVEGVAGRNLEAQRRPAPSKEPAVPRYAAESGVCRWRPIRSLPGSVTAFGPAPSRVIKGHRKGAAECTARGPAPGTSSRCASRPGLAGRVPLIPWLAAASSSSSSVASAVRPSRSPGFSPSLFSLTASCTNGVPRGTGLLACE